MPSSKHDASVLIVDDDPNIANLLESILRNKGFSHIEVTNSSTEALDILRLPSSEDSDKTSMAEPFFDIVISDVILPGVDGFGLSETIKNTYPQTLVLLISGYDIDDLDQKLIDSGADDFLTKPFQPSELVARIELLIKKNRTKKTPVPSSSPTLEEVGHQVPHIGDTIDSYQILEILGWGKYSVIYKVLDDKANTLYAIKMLTRYALKLEELKKSFTEEIEILSQIHDENITNFYHMGHYRGCPFIVMDYVKGINLEKYMVRMGAPDLNVIANVMRSVASGLVSIHEHGIVHRDIKLSNILFDTNSNMVKLADFGIAEFAEKFDVTDKSLDRIIGTPNYMAPEIFKGEKATTQSDIYSYGVTMYQFITGKPPFVAKSTTVLFKKHSEETPSSIRKTRDDIPEELDYLITRSCMAKKPSDRPKSMRDVLALIHQLFA